MLNTMQTHVATILQDLALPNQTQPLQVFIAPPVPGLLGQPQVYIWGAEWDDKRQTMPRVNNISGVSPSGQRSGYHKITWNMYLYVMYMTTADNPNADQDFPLIIDAITNVLHTTPCPVDLTDPTTGAPSTLLLIGEHIHGQMAPVQDLNNQGMVLYDAQLVCDVDELIQA